MSKWMIMEDTASMAASPLGPPKPDACVDGWSAHTWSLSIEEGQPGLSCDCNLCHDGFNGIHGPDMDLMEMEAIDVRISIEHEPGQPWYGVDPYWWIGITPVTKNTHNRNAPHTKVQS